jgi:peptidoglycan/LPS O-acetylase OafA/YrhL
MDQAADAATRGESSLYRAHVDGLRALAIIAVVASHIGLPGFQGGYVGVDVFFVISGFLIIGQIVDDLLARRFSFGDFWSRRALRILPPLLVVLLVCFAVGCFVSVLPNEFFMLGQEALYAALMALNFLVAGQQGYFDAAATAKPFLHLWSLGVEEQFYIAAPLLLAAGLAAYRRWPRLLLTLLALSVAASFAACVYYSGTPTNLSFYMAPMRAWEFAAGGAIGAVLPRLRRLPGGAVETAGWLGLAGVLAAVFGFGPDAAYPSYLALLPVAGTALVIAAGIVRPLGSMARLMSWGPLVWIGLCSYAWYLWHWPLLVFAREYNFDSLPLPVGLALAALSLLLAWLTHLWIERPIKAWRRSRPRRLSWWPAATGLATAILIGLGLIGIGNHFVLVADPSFAPALFADTTAGPCSLRTAPDLGDCLTEAGGKPVGLLLGDSHAAAAYHELYRLAAADHSLLATAVTAACPSILTVETPQRDTSHCADGHRSTIAQLATRRLPLRYAILLDYTQLYVRGDNLISERSRVALGPLDGSAPPSDQRRFFIDSMRQTIDLLRRAGVAKILVVAPTPTFPFAGLGCIVRAKRAGLDPDARCAEPRAAAEAERKDAVDWLEAAVTGEANVRLADPVGAVCDAAVCRSVAGPTVLFFDNDHPTQPGEVQLLNYIKPDLDWVLAP